VNILLIGEYSRLHNSLKEGLQVLGHHVVLVSSGDQFKNYPSDVSIRPVFSTHFVLNPFRKVLFRLFNYDIATTEKGIRFWLNKPKFKNFDIVQLINEYPIETHITWEKKLLNFIFLNNKKTFLLACGDDFITNNYYLSGKMRYSILTPFLNDKSKAKTYQYSLKYVTKPFQDLHNFVFKNIKGVIASDMDYAIPYENEFKYFGLIPNPINYDKINFRPLEIDDKIMIFHGINRMNYLKKGNNLIDEALAIIASKHQDIVEVIRVENLPYTEYIEVYDKAHIIMDQVYAFDQGYNALEAMAKGKVVCTGAELEFEKFYQLEQQVAVNLLPDVNEIVKTLEKLINNRAELIAIGKRARLFIEKHHNYKKVAKQYLEVWRK
jgi:glycosyltransferase involved in cell wall biosynthesis